MPDGESAIDRSVGAATILAALKLDRDSIVAALLIGLPSRARSTPTTSHRASARTSQRSLPA
jgi:hypothetical protein